MIDPVAGGSEPTNRFQTSRPESRKIGNEGMPLPRNTWKTK